MSSFPAAIVVADARFKPELPEGCPATLSVPLTKIAQELGDAVMRNTVSLGVSAYLLGLPLEEFKKALKQRFANRPELAEQNIAVSQAGYEYAKEHLPEPEWRLARATARHAWS